MRDVANHPDPPGVDSILPALARMVSPGSLAFDIGANVGQSATVLLDLGLRVVSVEPHPDAVQEMRRVEQERAGEGKADEWTLYELACGARMGGLVLAEHADHLARGQLTALRMPEAADAAHGWGPTIGTRSVACTTVDSLTRRHGAPSLLKVDVEGGEVSVLLGAKMTLRCLPALFVEVHAQPLGDAILELLAWAGYVNVEVVRHPNYEAGSWGWLNHWWIVCRGLS